MLSGGTIKKIIVGRVCIFIVRGQHFPGSFVTVFFRLISGIWGGVLSWRFHGHGVYTHLQPLKFSHPWASQVFFYWGTIKKIFFADGHLFNRFCLPGGPIFLNAFRHYKEACQHRFVLIPTDLLSRRCDPKSLKPKL